MARYIGAALLVALVLWTGETSGACAWILWATDLKGGSATTLPLGGHDTKAACEQELTKQTRAQAQKPDTWFRCLPDTIDPRGAKR